ncbi:related to small nucleolar ribonucleoprotein [Rhynchosporium agropyri]|uniref:Related to small nucleolar ribonucleoprotein n=1 Tax=Rhynchosporium agropyri TaxID=914238 RepID=A0A1E1KLV2_9HELO|nr:related to small nucleolar ribonucleoprotein [Rhynchosporium agropyri]
MASILKRKRAPVDMSDTVQRSKSVKTKSGTPLRNPIQYPGWEAAFEPPPATELVKVEVPNGDSKEGNGRRDSLQSLEYDDIVGKDSKENNGVGESSGRKKKRKGRGDKPRAEQSVKLSKEQSHKRVELPALVSTFKKTGQEPWKLSASIGGRMVNADPVFSRDEKFLIVAHLGAVHVYSTANSLLTRSIKLKLNEVVDLPPQIIAFCLSPTDSDLVWVACSDGSIYSINWTSGAGAKDYWVVSSSGCIHMTVASMESAERRRDVVFTTEARKDGGFRITANELAPPNSSIQTVARTIYTSNQRINFLKTASDGSIVIAASGNKVLIGRLRSTEYDTIDKMRYEFRVFESTDAIKSLDIRVTQRPGAEGLKKANPLKRIPVVDLVVGDVRGVVFLHNDLFPKLWIESDGKISGVSLTLAPRKLHWHRQAVHTVKWSLDGNYLISGGTETVLVLWQLDTGKQQFLPHMAATIQNVVVSPTGSSYAVQLADNSAMVLSTSELKPTVNIAGIQTCVVESEPSIESQVERLEEATWKFPLVQKTPAVISPSNTSQLLLGVGETQLVRARKPLIQSNPVLQTIDLGSGHNLSRQALTRTNITSVNAAPGLNRITEPRITHMKISYDGEWLVTVDEWTPPQRDVQLTKRQKADLIENPPRREVFLKFWQWNQESALWELVSRIDAPHTSTRESGDAGRILDLAVDPSSLRFSTIGEDGVVRIWATKTRKRDGVVVRGRDNKPLRNWNCDFALALDKAELLDGADVPAPSGCVAFSEDGSILAAACNSNGGLVHFMDPDSGTIRLSQTGLFEDEIIGIEFLGQDLITLSEKLIVFDLVSEEARIIIKASAATKSLSTRQKQEMMHLSIDSKSRTIAVALPTIRDPSSLRTATSELVVFHQDARDPQLKEAFPTLITALLPALSSEGFLVLDTAAEIHSVIKKGTQSITMLAQSTSALQLDAAEDLADLIPTDKNEDEIEDAEEYPTPAATQDGDEEEEDDAPVVPQQKLAEIFNIGPAFALPPLEEMFYQVADLYAAKPQRKGVALG